MATDKQGNHEPARSGRSRSRRRLPGWHRARAAFDTVVELVILLVLGTACSSVVQPGTAASVASEPLDDATSMESGVVAESSSTALRVEARDVRLVRSGDEDLVLQFELANDTLDPLQPAHLGLDPHSNV